MNPATANPSAIFGPRELHVLCRLGDIMAPKSDEYPSFSELGCIEHVDSIAAYAPPDDIALLRLVLKALSFMPDWGLRWILRLIQDPRWWPEFLATNLRLLDLALRSLLLSLYFSGKAGKDYHGKSLHEIIDFSVTRVPKDA